jgi:hypothetical protein
MTPDFPVPWKAWHSFFSIADAKQQTDQVKVYVETRGQDKCRVEPNIHSFVTDAQTFFHMLAITRDKQQGSTGKSQAALPGNGQKAKFKEVRNWSRN